MLDLARLPRGLVEDLVDRCCRTLTVHLRRRGGEIRSEFDRDDVRSDVVVGVLSALTKGDYQDENSLRSLIVKCCQSAWGNYVRSRSGMVLVDSDSPCLNEAPDRPDDGHDPKKLAQLVMSWTDRDHQLTALALATTPTRREAWEQLGIAESTLHRRMVIMREKADPSIVPTTRKTVASFAVEVGELVLEEL